MIEKITLKGSPKEIGEQHGRLGKEEVLHSLSTYEELFHGYQGISWEEARERSLDHLSAIERYDLSLIEEMEGVAAGAGVDFEDILALNARTEIALGSYSGKKGFSDGCTVIGTHSPVSQDTIIGQNWDWKGTQSKSLLLLEIEQENRPTVTMITEGGMIGKIGYNSAGLGLCFNALLTNKKTNEIPIHLALRSVLNSYNLAEAIGRVKDGQTAASASMLIGQSNPNENGMVINLEVSPYGIDFIGGQDGYFIHTNHIISDQLKEKLIDTNEYKYDSSVLRYQRAHQLINTNIAQENPIDEQSYEAWLSDTQNKPSSINMYKNPTTKPHRQMETIFSIIMNLSQRKTYLTIGKPSEVRYFEI